MEGFCRYEGDLLEHLEFIKSPEQCQEACTYLDICHYFVYDYNKDDCELLGSPIRKCDILRGPPEPSYETCITITSTSTQPATQTTTPTYTSSMPTKKSTKTTTSFKTTQHRKHTTTSMIFSFIHSQLYYACALAPVLFVRSCVLLILCRAPYSY